MDEAGKAGGAMICDVLLDAAVEDALDSVFRSSRGEEGTELRSGAISRNCKKCCSAPAASSGSRDEQL